MIVTAARPLQVQVPLQEPIAPSVARPETHALSLLLVRLSADADQVAYGEGWGESLEALAEAVEVLAPVVVGADPLDHGALWERMVDRLLRQRPRLPGGAAALSALDQALWDLAGRALDLPVYRLIGGRRAPRLDAYATGLYLEQPSALAAKARDFLERGYRAVKMKVGAGREQDLAAVAAVRKAVGTQVPLLVDANQAYEDREAALEMGLELGRYEVFWYEEPLAPDEWADYAALRAALDTPIAGGETLRSPAQFLSAFQAGALDVAMPDVRLCGGITGLLKVAELARWFGVRISPHNWASPLGAIASAHAAVTLANSSMIEVEATPTPVSEELIDPPLTFEDGFLTVPDGPGLGVTVNEDFIQRFAVED
jgi:D-galactarolactone cycloisomerase